MQICHADAEASGRGRGKSRGRSVNDTPVDLVAWTDLAAALETEMSEFSLSLAKRHANSANEI